MKYGKEQSNKKNKNLFMRYLKDLLIWLPIAIFLVLNFLVVFLPQYGFKWELIPNQIYIEELVLPFLKLIIIILFIYVILGSHTLSSILAGLVSDFINPPRIDKINLKPVEIYSLIIEEINIASKRSYRKGLVFLALGFFILVAGFYYFFNFIFSSESSSQFELTNLLIRFFFLAIIEALAFFCLREYKNSFNEYKYFLQQDEQKLANLFVLSLMVDQEKLPEVKIENSKLNEFFKNSKLFENNKEDESINLNNKNLAKEIITGLLSKKDIK